MLILGIDTSTKVAGVALVAGGRVVAERRMFELKTHSQKLMPALDEVVREAGVELEDLAGIAVSQGPGSFTGLRIGAATAKTLAQALGKPLFGVNTLEALAYNVFWREENCQGEPVLVSPLLDAQKEQVYAALYEASADARLHSGLGGKLETLKDVEPVHIGQWIEFIESLDKPVLFLGDAVPLWKELILRELGEKALFGSEENLYPRAANVAFLGQVMFKKGAAPAGLLFQPVYLRRSEAERFWEERHKSCGR